MLSEPNGSRVDTLRFVVIPSASARLEAMRVGQIDGMDGIRPSDIEGLASEGFTVLSSPGFHLGFVGFNLHRPILEDVHFRHALVHGYNQEEIVGALYRYTVTPIQSLVPPAQGGWLAPGMPRHPFNPGSHTDAPGTESVFGILKGAGYTYHGAGYGDLTAYWTAPDGDPLPEMTLYTPTFEVAPTTAEHGARIVAEWNRCGLNNILHQPADFVTYTGLVFDEHDFDMFMLFWSVGRFPTHLYGLLHSSWWPWTDNAVGVTDPYVDDLTNMVLFSLNHTEQVWAAHELQRYLASPNRTPWAFPYMYLYSRVYFEIYAPQLTGLINSHGFGALNAWTLLNAAWTTPDGTHPTRGDHSFTYSLFSDAPESFNPARIAGEFEQHVFNGVFDELVQMDPYTHEDLPGIATDWTLDELIDEPVTLDTENRYLARPAGSTVTIDHGMKATFTLRDDVYWHDGHPFTAYDCAFALEFVRNNQICTDWAWKDLVDVQVANSITFSVYSDRRSQYFLYDWSRLASRFPPQVWAWLDGAPLETILAYDPTTNTTDTGPWPTPTCLIGTGPFIFNSYNPVTMTAEAHRNPHYFQTPTAVDSLLVELFYACGDVNRDGVVWAADQNAYALAFGAHPSEAHWNPDADLNQDDRVDWRDGALIAAYFGDKRDHP